MLWHCILIQGQCPAGQVFAGHATATDQTVCANRQVLSVTGWRALQISSVLRTCALSFFSERLSVFAAMQQSQSQCTHELM